MFYLIKHKTTKNTELNKFIIFVGKRNKKSCFKTDFKTKLKDFYIIYKLNSKFVYKLLRNLW